MTLCSDIVKQGYRENNLISINATLTANQLTEGMALLNSIVGTTVGNEVGEKLNDWAIGNLGVSWPYGWNQVAWQYPIINSRLLYDVAEPQLIYLPFDPSDGSRMSVVCVNGDPAVSPLTLNANGRLIEGAATLLINTTGFTAEWLYRSDLGSWEKVSPLVSTDPMPFPSEFDDYFQTMLALRLAPRNSTTYDAASVEALKRWKRQLTAKYAQRVVTPAGPEVLRLSEYDATGFDGSGPYGSFYGPRGWWG